VVAIATKFHSGLVMVAIFRGGTTMTYMRSERGANLRTGSNQSRIHKSVSGRVSLQNKKSGRMEDDQLRQGQHWPSPEVVPDLGIARVVDYKSAQNCGTCDDEYDAVDSVLSDFCEDKYTTCVSPTPLPTLSPTPLPTQQPTIEFSMTM